VSSRCRDLSWPDRYAGRSLVPHTGPKRPWIQPVDPYYQHAFDLGLAQRFDCDDLALAHLRDDENDFELELTLNGGRGEPYRAATIRSEARTLSPCGRGWGEG